MKNNKLFTLFIIGLLVLFSTCKNKPNVIANSDSQYLSIKDSAYFVGKETCKSCHTDKFETFSHTGMGLSFDSATVAKSSANFHENKSLYDKYKDLYYLPYWQHGTLLVKEFRLEGKDTIHSLIKPISYIVGSGQHTNSHITNTNGYLHQAPFTFYTQKGILDLPPGFENGANSRFSRPIELECMSCHNAIPKMVAGSINKYETVPKGIDCERCHGAGSIHVAQKQRGELVDTSKYIDYSIVNPGKLPINLQFDLCMRCHLQGNTVLNYGKSFLDFKPGTPLSQTMNVFLPRYKNDDSFIMASHADRLKQSKCFIETSKNANDKGLRPYKNAITCVTCHNPHISVKHTNAAIINSKCQGCHTSPKTTCLEKPENITKANNNCFSCHMPKASSIDIPHVSITDHLIKIPISKQKVQAIKQFIGLYCVNNSNPSPETKASAYLNMFEKNEPNNISLLDSAKYYLQKASISKTEALELNIRLLYLKRNFADLINLISQNTESKVLELLNTKSASNSHAWTAYRIGEAYNELNTPKLALAFYEKANTLAPYYYEFTNKLASTHLKLGNTDKAKTLWEYLIKENPDYAPPYNNLGYILMQSANFIEAQKLIQIAINKDPNYELALLNMATIQYNLKQPTQAKLYLKRILKFNPANTRARQLLQTLN